MKKLLRFCLVSFSLLGGCVYAPAPGDPAAPDRPPPAPTGSSALPVASHWDGTQYCRQPFAGPFGWLDPIGHVFGFPEPVSHLVILAHDVPATGMVIPSCNPGANDEVDIDGDWNFLLWPDGGQDRLLSEGNF